MEISLDDLLQKLKAKKDAIAAARKQRLVNEGIPTLTPNPQPRRAGGTAPILPWRKPDAAD